MNDIYNDTFIEFYHSKIKLIFAFIFFTPFMIGFCFIVYTSFIEGSIIMFLFSIFFTALFLVLVVTSLLKLVRQFPYLVFTNEYLLMDPHTNSEIKLYYDEIEGTNIIESGFQKHFQLYLHDEQSFFKKLSIPNKIKLGPNRLFGMRVLSLQYGGVPKRDRAKLVKVIDNIGALKRGEMDSIDAGLEEMEATQHKALLQKYDPNPIEKLEINKAYFKSAYLYSFFIFLFMLILFYILIFRDEFYLLYITVSFFTFPFAKLVLDAIGVHKIRRKVDKQKGATYYFEQGVIFFDAILFHLSAYLFPVAILFLIIRFMISRMRGNNKK